MKKTVLISLILSIVVILFFIVKKIPSHFYHVAITSGVDSNYLKIPSFNQEFYTGNLIKSRNINFYPNSKRWKLFHFENFETYLPSHHPEFQIIPRLTYQYKKTQVAIEFTDISGNLLVKIDFEKPFKLPAPKYNHKIFELPVFKNYIQSISIEKIWKDIFSIDLAKIQKSKASLKDMVYNLYILKLREKLIPNKLIKKINYIQETDIGFVEYNQNEEGKIIQDRYGSESIFYYHNGLIYKVRIKYHKHVKNSQNLRDSFINFTRVRISHPDADLKLFAKYSNLSYRQKISREGLTYLYSSWTHVKNNREYIRLMIQFLERGNIRTRQALKSLYQYAYNRYGTSFSHYIESLKETERERLKRLKHLEHLKNVKELSDLESNLKNQDDNKEEVIKYKINRAKEDGLIQSDDEISSE